jgi:hypothetical protein
VLSSRYIILCGKKSRGFSIEKKCDFPWFPLMVVIRKNPLPSNIYILQKMLYNSKFTIPEKILFSGVVLVL